MFSSWDYNVIEIKPSWGFLGIFKEIYTPSTSVLSLVSCSNHPNLFLLKAHSGGIRWRICSPASAASLSILASFLVFDRQVHLRRFEKWKHKYQASILHTLSCNNSQYNKQLLMMSRKAEILVLRFTLYN